MPRRYAFRLFARLDVNLAILLRGETVDSARAYLVNISPGGGCLTGIRNLVEGAPVQLEITTPNLWDPLLIDAVVVWRAETTTGPRAGVRFEHHDAQELSVLRELIASCAY